ncbi:hypothetical protein FF38_04040 [Lucilia cuprina]|uniref:Uncharacterized protein n=1 Tax=Lucilia cuprina TaxID=7375 RepID=A0A0L0C9R7_LUCCU|nr:hypothetical protein FF38_04040 [Lucilia cuprina]
MSSAMKRKQNYNPEVLQGRTLSQPTTLPLPQSYSRTMPLQNEYLIESKIKIYIVTYNADIPDEAIVIPLWGICCHSAATPNLSEILTLPYISPLNATYSFREFGFKPQPLRRSRKNLNQLTSHDIVLRATSHMSNHTKDKPRSEVTSQQTRDTGSISKYSRI